MCLYNSILVMQNSIWVSVHRLRIFLVTVLSMWLTAQKIKNKMQTLEYTPQLIISRTKWKLHHSIVSTLSPCRHIQQSCSLLWNLEKVTHCVFLHYDNIKQMRHQQMCMQDKWKDHICCAISHPQLTPPLCSYVFLFLKSCDHVVSRGCQLGPMSTQLLYLSTLIAFQVCGGSIHFCKLIHNL
jgi:hypothetical protein